MSERCEGLSRYVKRIAVVCGADHGLFRVKVQGGIAWLKMEACAHCLHQIRLARRRGPLYKVTIERNEFH